MKKGLLIAFGIFLFLMNSKYIKAEIISLEQTDGVKTVENGSEFSVTVMALDFHYEAVTFGQIELLYEISKVQYINYEVINPNIEGCTSVKQENDKLVINIDCKNTDKFGMGSGAVVNVNFNAISSEDTKIDVTAPVLIDAKDNERKATYEPITIDLTETIPGGTLNSLKVFGKSYPITDLIVLDKTTEATLDITTTSVGKVTINTKELSYGVNEIELEVTNNNKTKTYTLQIERYSVKPEEEDDQINGGNEPDDELPEVSGSRYLSDLKIEGYQINFNKDIFEYEINLPVSVTELNISAILEDSKGSIRGTGLVDITPYQKSHTIISTGSDGESQLYKIIFTNRDTVNRSNELSSLKVNGKTININDKLLYLIGINDNTIDINAVADSSSAQITISEYEEKIGINIITITVSDEGLEDKIYTLYIDINDEETYYEIDKLPSKLTSDTTLILKQEDELLLSKDILKILKDSEYTLKIKIVNEYDGLLYSLTIDKNIEQEKDINLIVNYENNLFTTKLPENVTISYFIENIDTSKKLYDQNNNEISAINHDNYYTFKTTSETIYQIGQLDNSETEPTKSSNLDSWIIVGISLAIGIVLTLLVIIIIKNKRRFKKSKKEIPTSILETTPTEIEVLDLNEEQKEEIEKL